LECLLSGRVVPNRRLGLERAAEGEAHALNVSDALFHVPLEALFDDGDDAPRH
jgi:hypothetical protein